MTSLQEHLLEKNILYVIIGRVNGFQILNKIVHIEKSIINRKKG